MNVMKNEYLSMQKKLRLRGQKHPRPSLLGYHTVSRGLPFPTTSASLGLENTAKFSSTYQTCVSSSTLDITSEMSTSEESSLRSFHSMLFMNTPDVDYEQFQELTDNSVSGIVPGARNLEYDSCDSEENLFDIQRTSTGLSLSNENTSEETSRPKTFSTSEGFSFKKHNLRTTQQMPSSSSATHRVRSTPTKSNTSSRTYLLPERTPRMKSTRRTPGTSGSGRVTSSDEETGSYILAVTEGRGHARAEVGIAAIDTARPHLILCQISDSQRYIHSLTKMSVLNFVKIIMPNTFVDGSPVSKLYTDVRKNFPHVEIMTVQRRHFSESTGMELIKQYCIPETESIMVLLKDKFYALSAASALIKYVEYSQNILFAPRSVKVEYQGTEDSMIIDLNTANRLELVISKIKVESAWNNTLLGVLNHCRTKGGVRLLRANILQPPCSLSKIEMRLDCVTELIKKPLLFFALESAITNFANVESLLTLCMHEPQQDGLKAAEFQLKYVLLLKTILEQLPSLRTSLEEATCQFYSEVRENLSDLRYKAMLDRILKVVPESAKAMRGSLSAHLHSCFAIKTGINGLLDIAKKTYCEIVQEIWDLINSLREKHDLPLKMSYSASRGFHVQYKPEKNVKTPDLPKEFILVKKTRSTYYFYTPELVALDLRSQQALNEVKIMSNVILYELLNDVRQNVGCLFNLSEYIAELDVIVGFAHVSSGQNYVRPKFGNFLEVVESRHPILDVILEGKVISNDIFAARERSFAIITGPNQSGKSIYIGQIALLQIMAQIGCYIPAKEATFRLADRLFSKMGCDAIESSASTLIAEMQEIEYLRQNLTANSLVIVDELCRGTSVEEGTNLAFVICEELLDSSAFIFVTTHYMYLTKLEEMYYNVTNYHFESQLNKTECGMSLRFSHKRLPGVTKAEQYGLQIAELTSFPSDILATAKKIAERLSLERKPVHQVVNLAARYRIAVQYNNELAGLNEDTLPEDIENIKLRYKTMLLNLGPMNAYYADFEMNKEWEEGHEFPMNINGMEIESNNVKKTHSCVGRSRRHWREPYMQSLCKKIERKYRLLMARKRSQQFLRKLRANNHEELLPHDEHN